MRPLWTGVSAIALIAMGAGAAVAASAYAPAGEAARVVTVELADANQIPAGGFYVSLANAMPGEAFAYTNGDVSVRGRWLNAPPAAFTFDTASVMSLGDVAVTRNVGAGVQIRFGYGDAAQLDPYADDSGVFLSPASLSPFAALGDGGAFGGAQVSLGDALRLRFGIASRGALDFDPHLALSPIPRALLAETGAGMSAQTMSAAADWNFADWGALSVTGSQTAERGTVLGRAIASPLAVSNGASTQSIGISARVGFGDGWVTTVAFNAGQTHLDLQPGLPQTGDLNTQSLGLAVTKEDLFGNDVFGFSVSRPLQANGMTFGQSAFGPQSRVPVTALTTAGGGAAESDMQLGYVTTFLNGSLALQANASYQMNANGESGKNAVTGVARAQLKF